MKKLASIDIGSQTIRLLIANCPTTCEFITLHRDRAIVRLGEGMNQDNLLKPEAIKRAVSCISSYIVKAKEYDVEEIFPVATACVRNANNAQLFLEKIYDATGIRPFIVSGEDEALLGFRGVQSVIKTFKDLSLIIDIGGGSTEFSVIQNESLSMIESIDLGVITLSEKHLQHDPPLNLEIDSISADILHILKSQSRVFAKLAKMHRFPFTFIGTAGTVTTLAAMDLEMNEYDPDNINGYSLKRQNIEKLFAEMAVLPSKQRSLMPGLEPGRETVIIPGTLILLIIMNLFKNNQLFVSDAGLLEGVILEKIDT